MTLLLLSWLVLTVALGSVLAVVIGVQAVLRRVRRPSGHVPAPRRATVQDLLPTS